MFYGSVLMNDKYRELMRIDYSSIQFIIKDTKSNGIITFLFVHIYLFNKIKTILHILYL